MRQILIFWSLRLSCHASEWGYFGENDPTHWSESDAECGGLKQSPIDIVTQDIVYAKLSDVVFHNFSGSTQEPVKVSNNGHTLQIQFLSPASYITASHYQELYYLKQVHFHWGSSDLMGSEHTINGQRFSMEMHAVHIQPERGTIVVISKIFKAVQARHGTLDDLLRNVIDLAIAYVPYKDSYDTTLDLSSHNIETFLGIGPENLMRNYCSYQGSLTTPPCSEIVTWLLDFEIGSISENKLNELRSLHIESADNLLVNNFRDTQPLNGRKTDKCSGISSIRRSSLTAPSWLLQSDCSILVQFFSSLLSSSLWTQINYYNL
ncbi:carbonic anhydrase 3 [Eurytemora carolleeae]|uniref:carbonic anhydrase 3 n=1 Tax=Eurytemora carolleeae TaxID=1294199 RepID=UPI000C78AD38|nr:carbonic anhydrase 3 [Eurytemora carolleeae]|eukprot:XP_023331809.1 carbonic anhydrase 3-like [Eurytemora affinis]